MNGFDGMLFGGLSANPIFLDFFHGANNGTWQAINAAMYQIGGVSALIAVGPCVDTWGRKVGMLIGAVIIVVGVIINGTTVYTASTGQLQAGRFILGFGVSIVSGAGPIYVVETAHPAWRSIITVGLFHNSNSTKHALIDVFQAYCNTFWFIGSVLVSGANRGAITIQNNNSWLIPIWLQVLPALTGLQVALY